MLQIILDTQKYYTFSEIDKNILKHVSKELPRYFTDLKIKSNERCNPIIAYEFTFKLYRVGAWIENKYKR
ncbi:hypothetical protein [Nosocomiicoccus ampullae]|uniref:hypothetical protein n=1 Tax=Nosocomiicoccus ampullae TaxID=489910 RepID=UPI003B82F81B